MKWDISGHKKQIDLLEKSIELGKLSHGYIFAGPQFVGKRTVAFQFAQNLLCEKNSACGECGQCKTFTAKSNADFITIGLNDSIKIEEIRDLIYRLSLKPYAAKHKVAVIDNSENMTVEAQNALLKSLEEPKEHTIIILITSNPNKLLRTITSRAQKINFGLVSTNDYEKLIADEIDEQTKDLVLTFAFGRPGFALSISTNQEFVDELKETNKNYLTIRSEDLPEKLKLAYELTDLKSEKLKRVLDFWQIKLEQELVKTPGVKIANGLNALGLARRYVDQNVNSKLLLTNLMLNLT